MRATKPAKAVRRAVSSWYPMSIDGAGRDFIDTVWFYEREEDAHALDNVASVITQERLTA